MAIIDDRKGVEVLACDLPKIVKLLGLDPHEKVILQLEWEQIQLLKKRGIFVDELDGGPDDPFGKIEFA